MCHNERDLSAKTNSQSYKCQPADESKVQPGGIYHRICSETQQSRTWPVRVMSASGKYIFNEPFRKNNEDKKRNHHGLFWNAPVEERCLAVVKITRLCNNDPFSSYTTMKHNKTHIC